MADNPTDADLPLDEQIRLAIREVRLEGAKAAAVHACVDGVLVFLLVNLLGSIVLFRPESTGIAFDVPGPLFEAGAAIGLVLPEAIVLGPILLLALGIGLVVLVGEFALLYRRHTVEAFERGNPEVREALRTARDAVESDEDTIVARELYRSVLAGLRRTSSRGFVDSRRLSLAVILVAALAVASVGVTLAGVQVVALADLTGGAAGIAGTGEVGVSPEGDEPIGAGPGPDAILGEIEDVDRGEVDRVAQLEGEGNGDGAAGAAYDSSGFATDPDALEPAFAGYTEEEQIEDADIILEYNRQIRERGTG